MVKSYRLKTGKPDAPIAQAVQFTGTPESRDAVNAILGDRVRWWDPWAAGGEILQAAWMEDFGPGDWVGWYGGLPHMLDDRRFRQLFDVVTE